MCSRYEIQPRPGKPGRLSNLSPAQFPKGKTSPFEKDKLPIILCSDPETVVFSTWNFTPGWDQERMGPMPATYNARIETITNLKTFAPYVENRCLVLFNAFYEYEKRVVDGKKKSFPWRITKRDQEEFCVGGIFRIYQGEIYHTVVTTEPTIEMSKIHHRMPLILEPNEEKAWLENRPFRDFANRSHVALDFQAMFEEKNSGQGDLFG